MNNTISSFIFFFIFAFLISGCARYSGCSQNWKVTGFYTPIESDFETVLNKRVKVEQLAILAFNINFINAVKVEGWGKTRFGWYLGYYGGRWHKRSSALNSIGKPLVIGAVAVDNDIIRKGERLNIPSIQQIMQVSEFVAVDVGSAVKNRHIDIYTGEGHSAKLMSYRVTGNHEVCRLKRKVAPVVDLSSK